MFGHTYQEALVTTLPKSTPDPLYFFPLLFLLFSVSHIIFSLKQRLSMLYGWLLNHQEGATVTQVADYVPDNEFVFEGALSRQRVHAAALERLPPAL